MNAKEPVRKGLDLDALVAIDVHAHAEISLREPQPPTVFQEGAKKYFKHDHGSAPTIPEIAAYYRERKMACVIFSVDGERARGIKPVSNEEVAELAAENSDVMIPFASIDPARGAEGVREARRLIQHYGVRGFKFHPTCQGFFPNDRMAYPMYQAMNDAKMPVIFHSGHSGIGSGMRCGGGLRLQNSNPMLVEDVAMAFPDMQIILAHPVMPEGFEEIRVRNLAVGEASVDFTVRRHAGSVSASVERREGKLDLVIRS